MYGAMRTRPFFQSADENPAASPRVQSLPDFRCWCHLIRQSQSIRHSERSEESLRVPAIQDKEGFLASLGMTDIKMLAERR